MDFQVAQVEEFEAWLDCIYALCNFKVLAKANCLEEIPEDEPAGFAFHIFSKPDSKPLPAVKLAKEVPAHFKCLLEDGPLFAGREWLGSFRPTVQARSVSRVSSCSIVQINCCELDGGRFLISFHATASAQGLMYLGGLLVDRTKFFIKHGCSCSMGQGSIKDEDADDARPQRGVEEKGGCSHIAAACEILARLQDSPQSYHLVVRDSKGPRLEDVLCFNPLKDVLKILKEAQKQIFLAKTPLDKPQPTPTCVCHKAVDHYSNAVVLQCRCCEDKFHHCCTGLKKTVAQNTKDDWICGWCSGADIDIADNRDDEGDVCRGIDALQEHTWTMVRIVRKKKGEPKPQQGEEVTYTRLWGKTVFFYRISKRKRC